MPDKDSERIEEMKETVHSEIAKIIIEIAKDVTEIAETVEEVVEDKGEK